MEASISFYPEEELPGMIGVSEEPAAADLYLVPQESGESTERKYTADQIIELSKRVERNEPGAFEEMVLANQGLVYKIASQYISFAGKSVDLEDLRQEGTVGLIYAIDRFNWRLGNRFSTYAKPWIEQSVRQAVSGVHSIRLPNKLLEERSHLNRIEYSILVRSGKVPSADELSLEAGLATTRVEAILNAPKVDTSLNQLVGLSNELELWETIADENADDPLEVLLASDQTVFKGLLRVLAEKDREVVMQNLGLNGQPPLSQTQIAEQLNVSPQRISQIIDKSFQQIRHLLENPEPVEEPIKSMLLEEERDWEALANELSMEEIEVLEMSLEGFSDLEIGQELGIGVRYGVKPIKKDLCIKFAMTVEELMEQAPQILQIATAQSGERVEK